MLRNFAAYASALAGYTDCPTVTGARTPRRDNAVARQEVAGAAGLLGGLRDRPAALVPAAQMLRRGREYNEATACYHFQN